MTTASEPASFGVYRLPARGKLRPGGMVVRREFINTSTEVSLLWLPDVGEGPNGPVYQWLVPTEAARGLAAALLAAVGDTDTDESKEKN
jgi:hypothetical protein